MQTFISCLQADELESFIAGELPGQRVIEVESHLSTCEACREALEHTVGDPEWWNDLEDALGTAPTNATAFDDDADIASGTEQREADHRRLIELLGPTDDPNMMGRIGSYEIVGILGQGGMGAVFKAFDAALNRYVAIKVLLPHLASSGAARARFRREGQAAAAVIDDHVLPIYAVDQWQGTPYLVMQYTRGVSLQKRLHDQGPLELREILRVGLHAAGGLAAAHVQGLVHRDVKPSNILLDTTVERSMLTDFGLARAVDDATLTRSGVVAGTPPYMSPEQARAETVDHRSDLFSLGSVLYAMCTGHAPFRAENSIAVLRLITDKEPRPIREVNPDVPEWLCAIIAKLQSKQAGDRYESAGEVANLLEDCLAHVQQPTTTPLPAGVQALAASSMKPAQNRLKARLQHIPPFGKLIAAAAFAFSLLFAGTIIVLELNKGTLTIESEADDTLIRITQDDEIVDTLTVLESGTTIRLAAGRYRVEIEGNIDGIAVANDTVTLQRGGKKTVRIVRSVKEGLAGDRDARAIQHSDVSQRSLDGAWRMVESQFLGVPEKVIGARILIEMGRFIEVNPSWPEDAPNSVSYELKLMQNGVYQRTETVSKRTYLGRYILDRNRLFMSVNESSGPYESPPIRATGEFPEPNCSYYVLERMVEDEENVPDALSNHEGSERKADASIVWGVSRDGLVAGAKLLSATGILQPGDPVVVQFVLKNATDEEKTVVLQQFGGSHPVLGENNRFELNLIGNSQQKHQHTIQPGKILDERQYRVNVVTTGMPPGEYRITSSSAFWMVKEGKSNGSTGIPFRKEIPFTLGTSDSATVQEPPIANEPKKRIYWGKPVANLVLGMRFPEGRESWPNDGVDIEGQLFLFNACSEPIDLTYELPPTPADWNMHVTSRDHDKRVKLDSTWYSGLELRRTREITLKPGQSIPVTGVREKVSTGGENPATEMIGGPELRITKNKTEFKYGDPKRLIGQTGRFEFNSALTINVNGLTDLVVVASCKPVPFAVFDAPPSSRSGKFVGHPKHSPQNGSQESER